MARLSAGIKNLPTSTISTRSLSSFGWYFNVVLLGGVSDADVFTSGEGEGATVLICADSTALSTSNSSTFRLLIGNRESVTSKIPSFGGC